MPGSRVRSDLGTSAGEHEYREIRVEIFPFATSAQVRVSARQKRGTDLLADNRLGAFDFRPGAVASVQSPASILRAAAQALIEAADTADRL